MSKIVVVHHKLHADEGEEGIYRLIYATQVESTVDKEELHPDFDPEQPISAENRPTRIVKTPVVQHVDHQEIVWDAGDEKWKGREPADIAREQRQIVRDTIAARAAEEQQAAAEKAAQTHDLGGVGEEL